MSATILNPKLFCKNLGINYKDVEFIKCESIFPVKNRLIHYSPVGSLSFKNKSNNESISFKYLSNFLVGLSSL